MMKWQQKFKLDGVDTIPENISIILKLGDNTLRWTNNSHFI